MRILTFPASLDLGGSQLNAIEIAATLHRRGHDVHVAGPHGPLAANVVGAGIPFHAVADRPRVRPSPAIMRSLLQLVDRYDIEVTHGWEWPPITECTFGPYLRRGVATVGTIMSMGVAPFLPREIALTVGTHQIADAERGVRPDVTVLEPPVDTVSNRPAVDTSCARQRFGVSPDDFLVVVVGRLAAALKQEGLIEAVRASAALATELPLRLLVVGDGPARGTVADLAAGVNRSVGREVVTLTGALDDPRDAYAAADVCFGMGSSALRAMAFARPLIVQGERGFWSTLTPETAEQFLHHGWYGIGDGTDGSARFAAAVRDLHASAERRDRLGRYGRQLVEQRFSLDHAADLVESLYERALSRPFSRTSSVRRLARPAAQVGRYAVRRKIAHRLGTAVADDFNALSAQSGVRSSVPERSVTR